MGLRRRASALTILALSASAVYANTRKSLSFAPRHPGAYFHTTDLGSSGSGLGSRDPHVVAHAFLDGLLRSPSHSYYIRKDSYTDTNTGISHIYVRQLVHGHEVADGDINLNIVNGRVVSYGNSFFQGNPEGSVSSAPIWHQGTYCAESTTHPNDPACGETLDHVNSMASFFPPVIASEDPRAAAFFFLQAAYPGPTSLIPHFDSFKAERHYCADSDEVPATCEGWTVTGIIDSLKPIRARQVYVQTPNPDGSESTVLNLAWRLEVTLPDNSYEAYVSVHDPSKIISVGDWVHDAPIPDSFGWISKLERAVFERVQGIFEPAESVLAAPVPFPTQGTYRVYKWGVNDPESGKRTIEKEPSDRAASPFGWHSVPAANDPLKQEDTFGGDELVNFTTTIGNNIIAQANWDGGDDWQKNHRPNGGPNLVFDFPDPSDPGWGNAQPREYVNASVSQVFYTANMYHDLLYHYGFDEVSGNFQQHNFGKGGEENDAVILDAQDGSGFNNANFLTPPDGQKGRCRMFIFNIANPFRDGGLDAGIVIHEFSHGLSTRLTGGPANSNCLGRGESGGMGEGWGDWIATLVRSTKTLGNFGIGGWAVNAVDGIRHFPYSIDKDVNPSLYDFLQKADWREVHAIGEVWAQILWVVLNKLVEKHGFADSLFPTEADFYRTVSHPDGRVLKVPRHGNTLALQIVVNGMKLQPCRPTFIQARDAIIKADEELTGGENKCLLWKAFASRGLGVDAKKLGFATRPSINGFKVPDDCKD